MRASIWEHPALDHHISVRGKISTQHRCRCWSHCKLLFKTVDWKVSSFPNGSLFRSYKSPADYETVCHYGEGIMYRNNRKEDGSVYTVKWNVRLTNSGNLSHSYERWNAIITGSKWNKNRRICRSSQWHTPCPWRSWGKGGDQSVVRGIYTVWQRA